MFQKELRDSECRCGVCGWYGDLTSTCPECGEKDELFLITEDDFEIEEN